MEKINLNSLEKIQGGAWWTREKQSYVNGFSCTATIISMAVTLAAVPATFGASLAATGVMFASFSVCVGTATGK
ncbi:MAG: hypothetical protein Sapg2KO_32360 [Saprospiraceae bacterium]